MMKKKPPITEAQLTFFLIAGIICGLFIAVLKPVEVPDSVVWGMIIFGGFLEVLIVVYQIGKHVGILHGIEEVMKKEEDDE